MTTIATRTLFDEAILPTEDRDWLRVQEDAIGNYARRAVSDLMTIGTILIAVRSRLPRGHYKPWLRARTSFSYRTALRMTDVAEKFGPVAEKIAAAQQVEFCALYEIAEFGRPAALEEAVKVIDSHQPLTRDVAQGIVAKYRTQKPTQNVFKECEELPPTPAPDDSRIVRVLEDLARNNGPVILDSTVDADDPDDVTYTVHFIGVPIASGRTLPEAVDRLTGYEKKKQCTRCGKMLPYSMFTAKKGRSDGLSSECKEHSRGRSGDWKAGQRAA